MDNLQGVIRFKYKISTTVRGADKPITRRLLIMFPQTYGAYSAHNQQQRR